MKIYTKTGDKGTTGLLTGERIEKDSLRVEAYGIVDEINSALGLSRALCTHSDVKKSIFDVQRLLMLIMAELASVKQEKPYITGEHVKQLEDLIDQYDALLEPLKQFLIPGDNPGAAALDVARTTTRRAERQAVRLSRREFVNENVLIALNRLSDLCFTLSRVETEKASAI
jgi:cob(I)alamin adenosyltransferase